MTRHSTLYNYFMSEKKILITLPSVSQYFSRKEWENACWKKISEFKTLDSLVTEYERHNLVMRAAVIERIGAGKRYRQIAEELWLSPQTISSIKKALNENRYQSYRERGQKERKKRIYTSSAVSRRKPDGRPVRTKYGTVYLP